MAEYIDHEKALAFPFANGNYDSKNANADFIRGCESYREYLESIPSADVKPVVRCRDCDLWNEWDHAGHESLGNFRCSCAYWSVEDGVTFYTAPTDFCSNGEKRINGDVDDKM